MDATEVDLADYLDDVVDVVLTCDDEAEYIDGDKEEEDTHDDENFLPLDEHDSYSYDEEDDEEDDEEEA